MKLRVLIVEDESLIAMMAEDMVEAIGHDVARVCATVADAQATIEGGAFDAAVLDVNLNGDSSMPLAKLLKARDVPFAFATGYGVNGVDSEHDSVPVLTKPYSMSDLEALLARFSSQVAGTSSMTSSSDSNAG